MEFLASDALRGRGSASADELVAATYVGAQFRAYGIAPAGDAGSYIQRATLHQAKLTAPPQLRFMKPGAADSGDKVTWTCGKEFVVPRLSETHFSGRLRVVDSDHDSDPDGGKESEMAGTIVLILGSDRKKARVRARSAARSGAVAAIEIGSAEEVGHFSDIGQQLPVLPPQLEGGTIPGLGGNFSLLQISSEAARTLEALPLNTDLSFESDFTSEIKYTWNAVGILRGRGLRSRSQSAPNPTPRESSGMKSSEIEAGQSQAPESAVLLSAHLDHLGIGQSVNGDEIYNGADDDASGTTAVLELARVLGAGRRPRRTVIFALFGSEETGGLGSTFFREHPPLALKNIAANLEFEMLGRADPAVRSDTVWITGWERSNLGPELAARGAKLVRDPHPEQNFFARSDNYVLAQKGVVAQTVSSYGLHGDYHRPGDDVAHIDFKHMDAAIGSLLEPVRWLVNSQFTPKWKEGGKP